MLMTTRAAIVSDKAAVDAAELALEGVTEENKVGSRTTIDVLNADQELLNAQVTLVQAKHDEAVAILQTRAAIGDLTAAALKLPITPYNPEKHYEEVRGKWIGVGG
jgi:outer membrane protein